MVESLGEPTLHRCNGVPGSDVAKKRHCGGGNGLNAERIPSAIENRFQGEDSAAGAGHRDRWHNLCQADAWHDTQSSPGGGAPKPTPEAWIRL